MKRKHFSIAAVCALFLMAGCQKQQETTQTPSTPPPQPSQSADSSHSQNLALAQPTPPPSPTHKAAPDPSRNPASPLYAWINFSPPGGQASILFPGPINKQEVKTEQTKDGEIQLHLFMVETGLHYAYGICYYDLPGTSEPKLDLADLEDAIVKKVNGQIVSARTIQVDNYPAAEYEIVLANKPKFSGTGRTILVGHRVYELAMVYYTGDPNPDVRDAFFKSFTLQN